MFELVEIWQKLDGDVFVSLKHDEYDSSIDSYVERKNDFSIKQLEEMKDFLEKCLQMAYKKDF